MIAFVTACLGQQLQDLLALHNWVRNLVFGGVDIQNPTLWRWIGSIAQMWLQLEGNIYHRHGITEVGPDAHINTSSHYITIVIFAGQEGQGDKWLQKPYGLDRPCPPLAALEGGRYCPDKGGASRQGEVHLDYTSWQGGALDCGQLRQLYSSVELQVCAEIDTKCLGNVTM